MRLGLMATLTTCTMRSLIITRAVWSMSRCHDESDAHCHRGLDTEQQNVRWSWRLRWEEVAHYWFYWLSAPLLCVHFVLWCEPGCCYQCLLGWWGQDDKILPPIRNHLNVPCVQKCQILWSHCSSLLYKTPSTVSPTADVCTRGSHGLCHCNVWSLGIIGSVSANTGPEKQATVIIGDNIALSVSAQCDTDLFVQLRIFVSCYFRSRGNI